MLHGGLPYMKIIRHFLMAAGLTMGLMANSVYAETEQVKQADTTDKEIAATAERAEVLMVLDKSGSMYGLTDDTIGGFNSMIQKYREQKLPVRVTTVLFNNKSDILHDRQDIATVKELTDKDYVASGTTALLDALGESLTRLSNLPDVKDSKDTQVVVVIITDGQENSSTEYKKATIKDMISDLQKKGWKFMFLGANIDAVSEAGSLGIDTRNAVKYKNTGSAVRSNYDAVVSFTMEAVEASGSDGSMKGDWKNSVEADDGNDAKKSPEAKPESGSVKKAPSSVKSVSSLKSPDK